MANAAPVMIWMSDLEGSFTFLGPLPDRMSHELRTPLNAIIGFTGTLLMKLPGPLTEQQSRQLQTIRSSARHLLL
jgi:K+-sensing histidine kinase KdpD